MLARLGFVASVLSRGISTSRTCRLRNATPDRLRELTAANLQAFDGVLDFLQQHRIRLYRISSNLIPFASHPVNTIRWWEEFSDTIRRLGARIRSSGVRVSMHPGQFTVLNSPSQAIVQTSVDELRYHARLLDALGTAPSSKIVIHVGGLYGASETVALDRFVERAKALPPEVHRRLVVENDDRLFDAEEVLYAARAVTIPVVFDWLHHRANPCARPVSGVLAEIFATWTSSDGRPKVHLSSQAPDAPPGAHADYVAPADLARFAAHAPGPFDCMLEAKEKDRALLRLRAQLSRRGIRELDLAPQPSRRG